ncbi:uncharacterized protein LOC132558568 [Ylistrum balloti]|uniref:uncharacterized protein LOC132558568 n=1 Tax=Ylistrum balloti TaxID=509963 RepID=UPI002905CC56|nr:uncharacterized protein LOC132558568 [Ylistrum balloti]
MACSPLLQQNETQALPNYRLCTMDSWCGKLLTSVVVLPFMAGNCRTRRNGSRYYDCLISSRVLFLVVFAIVIVFTASKRIPSHTQIRLGFVLLLLTLLMITAMTCIFVLGYLVNKHGLQSIVAAKRNTSTPKLQVIFLWMFGLATVFYCGFLLAKQIECSIYISGGYFWNIVLFFNTLLIICLFIQMIFITYFSPYELEPTDLVNCTMSMLLAGNVSIFVYVNIMGNTLSTIIDIDPDNDIARCLKNNSTMILLLEKSSSILRPNFTEFVLLSCTILLEIWSPTKVQHPNGEVPYIEISDINDSERSSLLSSETTTEHSRNEGRRTACQLITLIISIALGLGQVVCYVVMAMDIGDVNSMRYVSEVYELVLKAMIVLAIFIGFFCLVQYCSPDRSSQGLKTWEHVYLLSAFGLFMMHICECIGGDVSSDISAKMLMSTSIISIFQDYLQVVFLLHANRCKKCDPRSNINLLESVLIFTMISNFMFWFNDSFLITEFPVNRILEHDDFSKDLLNVVYEIFLPVSVFFRFTSFLEYYATFGKYNA